MFWSFSFSLTFPGNADNLKKKKRINWLLKVKTFKVTEFCGSPSKQNMARKIFLGN